MILTKHNRTSYFFVTCLAIPLIVTMLIMLFSHNQLLKAHYKHINLKLYYQTLKYSFSFEYALAWFVVIAIPLLLFFLYVNYFFYVEFDIKPYLKHIRGVKIASINWLKSKTSNRKLQQLLLCGVKIPSKVENLHFMIAGSTGTGKSTIINELIASSIQRGDKVIVIDPNGGFLSKFYQDGDKILNPFDKRSELWDTFFDIKNDSYDFEQIISSMIPPQANSSSEEWNGYARTLLRGLMKSCRRNGIFSIHRIIEMLNSSNNQQLKEFVAGTEAESLFAISEGSTEGAINSTRFVLAKYISSYQYLQDNIGVGFSIRDFIQAEQGNLWITWREDMVQALKPLISTWCDICASSILSNTNHKQNILFVIDELDTLNQLPSLEHLATKGRKHGLNIVACIQSTAQLDATYGKDKAIALRSCFRNLVVLGGSKTDDKTANDLSNALGEHEVLRLDKSESYKSNTTKKQAFKERIVLPSEIQSLPQLEGYLAFALDYPIVKFKIDRVDYPTRAENFLER